MRSTRKLVTRIITTVTTGSITSITTVIPRAPKPVVSYSNCKLCGGPADFVCANRNEHGTVSEIHTFRCRQCGVAFVGNQLTPADLTEAYSRDNIDEYYAEIYPENHKKHL